MPPFRYARGRNNTPVPTKDLRRRWNLRTNPEKACENRLLINEFVNSLETYFDAIFAGYLCYNSEEKEQYLQWKE